LGKLGILATDCQIGKQERRRHRDPSEARPLPAHVRCDHNVFRKCRAHGQPGHQSSDVSGVVDARRQPEEQVVADEGQQTSHGSGDGFLGDRQVAQIEHGDGCARESEDCAGRSRTHAQGMPPKARQASRQPAERVEDNIVQAAQYALSQLPQVPQTPHVEQDVNQPDVHVVGSQHPPRLRAQR